MDVEICENPVMVVGAPRSGTTALAWALDQHPELGTLGESQILVDLFASGRLDKNYKREGDASWLRRRGIDREQFLTDVGLGLNVLLTRAAGGRRWVDKTPYHTLMLPWLADMFPGAKFVHILRDGRRVVHSMVRFGEEGPRWSQDFEWACRTWARFVTAARDFEASNPGRCITVRNEELVDDPGGGFGRILAFLDLAYDPAPAEFFATNRLNSSFGADAQGAGVVGTRPAPWSEWDAARRRLFREIAGETMEACGLATPAELAIPV
jgi:hypothetical protein